MYFCDESTLVWYSTEMDEVYEEENGVKVFEAGHTELAKQYLAEISVHIVPNGSTSLLAFL